LRRRRNWGPCRIEGYLRNYAKQPVGHTTIHKILNQAGLNNPIPRPRRIWGRRRFQRARSNELWQADFKQTEDDEWMISYLDDHSRFVPGSRTHHNPTTEHAITLLEESINQYGKPEQVLTDRGTQFYPARRRHLRIHGVLHSKRHRTYRRKRTEAVYDRQDRGVP
jgi:hypothetical protein